MIRNRAIPPHYLTKVRYTEFYNQIKDLGKIREGRRMGQTAHEGGLPVCTDVQRGAGFFNKIKILEESARAISPHYLTKVRDAHISCQITDLGKYGNGMI